MGLQQIVLWQNLPISATIFALGLLVLLALRQVSLLNVLGNAGLGLLTTTMAFRVYRAGLAVINRSGTNNANHPFASLLASDVGLSVSGLKELLDLVCVVVEWCCAKMRASILIQDPKESIVFAILMYALTYVGQHVTALSLFTLLWLALFTLPKVYDVNRAAVDRAVLPVANAIKEFVAKIDFEDNNNNNYNRSNLYEQDIKRD